MSLDTLWLDIRHAIRSLRASRSFTIAVLLVLMFGVGATTAVFSIVDAVVLRGLPFVESDRLMAVGEWRVGMRTSNDPNGLLPMTAQNYLDIAGQQRVFSAMGAMTPASVALGEPGGDPEELSEERATASFFDVLGVKPALGQLFTVENESDGRHAVAVLSHALWLRRFGGDAHVLGQRIQLDGEAFDVVGVMPSGFTYPAGAPRAVDVWVPYVVPANERTRTTSAPPYLQTIARLASGVTPASAGAQIAQLSAALQAAHPETNKTVKIGTRSLRDNLVGADVASWMLMLLGAVAIVLLIACANVAGLFLARASSRSREIGIRAALGSSRARIVRHLVVESLLLSAAGAVLATMLAWWLVAAVKNALPAIVPRTADISIDLRVLGATALVSIISGVIVGCLPALRGTQLDLSRALNVARGRVGQGRGPMQRVLVVAEVALAVVLLVGAGLFVTSFVVEARIDPGVRTDNVLLVQLAPRAEPGRPKPDLRGPYGDIVSRVAGAPGVVDAALIVGGAPLGNTATRARMVISGLSAEVRPVSFRRVTPDYFRTLAIPVKGGRIFAPDDRDGQPLVAAVNETAARAYFGGHAIGASVTIDGISYVVVGVVGDTIQNWIESKVVPEAYVPIAYGATSKADLIVHTIGSPYDALPAVRAAMRLALPDTPARDVRTMDAVLSKQLSERRLDMLLLSLFGLVGLVTSAVGLYGVMAHMVSERTREIGLRMALGAPRAAVLRMVLRTAATLVVAGLVVGGTAAWMLTTTADAFLFGVKAADPRVFLVAIVVLCATGLAAATIPARRAASVDPLLALRSE